MRRSKIGLSLKISDERRSTTQEISAFGIASLSAAREGRVWMMSPMLPSFTIRIRICVGQTFLSVPYSKQTWTGRNAGPTYNETTMDRLEGWSYLTRLIMSEVE